MEALWQMSNGHIFHVFKITHGRYFTIVDMDSKTMGGMNKIIHNRCEDLLLAKAYVRNIMKLEIVSEEFISQT